MTALIDAHVHLVALSEADNGCFVSPRMLKRLFVRSLAWVQGFDLQDPAQTNAAYVDRLAGELKHSQKVKQAVLLGMDGLYDDNGLPDLSRTDFLISNRYVFQVVRRYPDLFLAGVSINPQRRDALEELDRCVEQGAALVKFLPNAQGFVPDDRRHLPFYKALAKHRVPLLSHVGYEFSLIGQDQSAGNPEKLRLALDQGVCVIAAHACSYGLGLPEPYFKTFTELVRQFPHFYADTSALSLPNRVRALFLLRRYPELHDRLIFATDYPLPVFAYPVLGRNYRKAAAMPSPFDRQLLLLETLGITVKDFSILSSIKQTRGNDATDKT